MAGTGAGDTRLIVIRGNSGSGKSALAAAVRAARPRGVAIVGQDQLRREILRVRDRPGNPAVGFIELSARYALDHGMHVVLEGVLYENIYGDMLRRLVSDHRGVTRCYRYELSFDETVRRHATKENCHEFGEAEMRQWWRDHDPLADVDEIVLTAQDSLDDSVSRVLRDCGW